ncbi:hypothetical protein PFFVO_05936, partial [Plasmodium falciparum Vietnam Oak-Knoll (FVO)]
MAAAGRGTDKSAKEVLDEIGEKIQKIATTKAHTHRNKLKGNFGEARFYNGNEILQPLSELCHLDYTLDTNVTDGHSNPCEGRQTVRFSDERRSQCMSNRIRGSENDNVGACAPYRRLHVCDRNLEQIDPAKITTTHNLLVDVLLAAKHEGESIIDNYPSDHHNKEGICTALARSFADIGDIIRGKDLYRGNKQEKDKLQDQLKKYFKELHNNLESEAKNYYNDDTKKFFKLREDWWNANRLDIWKAIICTAPGTAQYFRNACGGEHTMTYGQCRCVNGEPPTNFDYIPQYLRWFEEWAEDFCRIKQLKLQNVKNSCRGEDDNKYCSRNGYDCEQTINKIGHRRFGNGCIKCLFECNPYVKWIGNKEKDFEKQKKKCENEIYKNKNQTQSSSISVNDMYYDHFYSELKEKYSSIHEFINLLNAEAKCKNLENEDNESKIDFNDITTTFSGSQYCKPCPECGVEKKSDGSFRVRDKEEQACKHKNPYTPNNGVKPTEINVLSSGEGLEDITEKLKEFCKTSDNNKDFSLYEEWKCYYEHDGNEACILKKEKKSKDKAEEIQKSFFDFFTYWVAHMLKDSEDWKTKLSKCLKNKEQLCINNCNRNCKCYEKWIEKKEEEWEKIKVHYEKQKLPEGAHYVILEGVLELQFIKGITNAYGEQKEVQRIAELLRNKTKEGPDDATQRKTIIDELLDHELEEAHECRENNPEEKNCSKEPHDDLDDEDETHYNPCGKTDGTTVRAKQIAKKFQRDAKTQMKNNTRNDGTGRKGAHNSLVGDISKAYFKNGGQGSDLKGDKICDINTSHSNDSRGNGGGPCIGKDGNQGGDRMKIGTPWSKVGEDKTTYSDVYLPPRRQHMCTSNLEFLETKDTPLDGKFGVDKINHSFLGDVLLVANFEAKNIKELYKNNNDRKDLNDANDKETVCRAMKYSFADIGDIIRGTDMWDKDEGSKKMDVILKKIFGKIKQELPKEIQKKYKNPDGKHTQLRKDWWEANRHQVWRAMKCAIQDGSIEKCNGIPLDDYIPQRLRWMTEWAEWFCKMQKEAYNELKGKCSQCKTKDKKCTNKSDDCNTCTEACTAYNRKINTWKQQWDAISDKYQFLYLQAKTAAANGGPHASSGDVGEKDKPVVNFLFELYKQNGGKISTPSDTHPGPRVKRGAPSGNSNTVYSTAAGYIHQEAHIDDCNKQNVFCEKKKGGNDNNEKYAFHPEPYDHKKACACDGRNPDVKVLEDPCKMVQKLISEQIEKNNIHNCKKTEDAKWKCENTKLGEDEGVCMPPRRQNLCVHYLTKLNDDSKEEDLREAFIKSAAAETFLLRQYYNSKNVEDDKILHRDMIPPEFFRSMFYTFGDYRDICLDTDISEKIADHDVTTAKKKITAVFQKIGSKTTNGKKVLEREGWWKEYGLSIWKGMLCALSYNTETKKMDEGVRTYLMKYIYKNNDIKEYLEEFASRPPFLRWFTEWGEDFCKKQKKELVSLKKKCDSCTLRNNGTSNKTCDDNENCGACKTQCEKYKKWIGTWKKHYSSQKKKFQLYKNSATYNNGLAVKEANSETYKNDPEVTEANSAKHARDYLKTQLENMICTNGNTYKNCDYTCMNTSSSTNSEMPASLDYTPSEYKDKCNCVPDECSGLSVTGSGIPDGSAFGGGLPPGKCKGLEGPQKNMEPPTNDYIYDILKSTIPVGIALALGSITFLFIK